MTLLASAVLILLLPATAQAAPLEDMLDTASLTEELPDEASELLRGLSPSELPGEGVMRRLAEAAAEKAQEQLAAVCHTAGTLLLACVFVSLSKPFAPDRQGPPYVVFAGVAAIGAAAMTDLNSFLRTGLDSLESLMDYSRVLLPVLASASAASGAVGGAAAKYGATALMMDVLLTAGRSVAAPCICGYAALSLAGAAMGGETLLAAKKLMKTVCTVILSGICMAFTAWIALTGIVVGTADTLTARVTKTAVSAALPVVGSILSDAAGSLSAAAGILRNSIGIFGLLAVLGICLRSLTALGVRYLVYRLSAAVCCCVADKRMGDLVRDLGTCFGLMLSLNGAGALMVFISIYSLMRTVL